MLASIKLHAVIVKNVGKRRGAKSDETEERSSPRWSNSCSSRHWVRELSCCSCFFIPAWSNSKLCSCKRMASTKAKQHQASSSVFWITKVNNSLQNRFIIAGKNLHKEEKSVTMSNRTRCGYQSNGAISCLVAWSIFQSEAKLKDYTEWPAWPHSDVIVFLENAKCLKLLWSIQTWNNEFQAGEKKETKRLSTILPEIKEIDNSYKFCI